jgi:cytidylate kinase
MENKCYEMKGNNIVNRTTVLLPEGERRLTQNGLVIAITAICTGGIGSSTTAKELFPLLGLQTYYSTGNEMRAIAQQRGFFGEEGFNLFLQMHKDDLTIDKIVDNQIGEVAALAAKKDGIAVVDSKYMCIVWPLLANTTESPLILPVGVTAPNAVARKRLLERAVEQAIEKGLPIPTKQEIVRGRRSRMIKDKVRLPKVYPEITSWGPRGVSDSLPFPLISTDENLPPGVALQVIQYLSRIPKVGSYLKQYLP